jgi:hypothetical protein
VLADPPLAEWIEVRRLEVPGALGLDQEPRYGVERPTGGIADRVQLVRAGEPRQQRGEVGPLGRPAEPEVTERLADDALEEAGQTGRARRIAYRYYRPPILAPYYTAATGRDDGSERGSANFFGASRRGWENFTRGRDV